MLRFVFGRAGSGKSEYCLGEIERLARLGQRSILVVPEQSSYSFERALALRLRGVGAKVTVLARSAAARATARADGMDAEPIAGEHAGQWRFVFNTVPAGVAGEALLSRCAPGTLLQYYRIRFICSCFLKM